MDTIATEDDLQVIESPHRPDYDSFGGCVCGESYPCTTRGLVAEVRRLRRSIEEIADDNSPHDAQLTACFVAETWRG